MSIINWKHQDRISKVKNPSGSPDSIFRLYDATIWADQELKALFCSWQVPLQHVDEIQAERVMMDTFPVDLLPDMILNFTANRVSIRFRHLHVPGSDVLPQIMSVHRHFQLSSFRDRRFAFSQVLYPRSLRNESRPVC